MNKTFPYIYTVAVMLVSFTSCIKEQDVYPNDYRGNFEALWNIMDDRYCYFDTKEIDWNNIYKEYSPRIDTTTSKYSLFSTFGEMLAELKDGHVNLYSSFDRSRYWKWYTDYPSNFSSQLSKKYLGNNYRIAGPFQYNIIPNTNIGYLYYGSFANGFSDANIKEIFEFFKSCKGLIIDVRNNGGGSISNSEQLASYFFYEKTLTHYIKHKTGKKHNDFSEATAIYTPSHNSISWQRQVAVLTNRMSYSATNEFVCRMNSAPKTIFVGDKTGGGGGLPLSSELPNGWMVRFSSSPMFDADMNDIEMGIDPTIKIDLSKEDENEGIDTIIEKAILEILKKG